ncbi:MAG: hypothetical protein ACI9K1_002521 [Arcticibacterium sp.]|jgi:hypothetical protein
MSDIPLSTFQKPADPAPPSGCAMSPLLMSQFLILTIADNQEALSCHLDYDLFAQMLIEFY